MSDIEWRRGEPSEAEIARKKIIAEGIRARQAGELKNSNPYEVGSSEHTYWKAGYDSGKGVEPSIGN
jgi:hypothetical protein